VRFIQGPDNTWTIQMDVNAGKMITALERMPPSWGGDPGRPFEEGPDLGTSLSIRRIRHFWATIEPEGAARTATSTPADGTCISPPECPDTRATST